jgi:hypothetical protein
VTVGGVTDLPSVAESFLLLLGEFHPWLTALLPQDCGCLTEGSMGKLLPELDANYKARTGGGLPDQIRSRAPVSSACCK